MELDDFLLPENFDEEAALALSEAQLSAAEVPIDYDPNGACDGCNI